MMTTDPERNAAMMTTMTTIDRGKSGGTMMTMMTDRVASDDVMMTMTTIGHEGGAGTTITTIRLCDDGEGATEAPDQSWRSSSARS